MLTAKQRQIIEAIQNGRWTYQEIEAATGIKHSTVANNMPKLYAIFNVRGFEGLRQLLSPSQSELYVSLDKKLEPIRAAKLLVEVLGVTYCTLLDAALQNELKQLL